MKKHNLKLGLLFTVLAFALASGFFAIPSNAQAAEWHIRDDATVENDGTGEECSKIGIWNAASKTCTLTQDLNQGIIIDSNGITLDGNGHTITGYGSGNGVYLPFRSGVTIKNLNIEKFYRGIYLYGYSGNNTITNNTANSNGTGIQLSSSCNNTITNNTANSNYYSGIYLGSSGSSGNNTITNNTTNSNRGAGIYLHNSGGNTLTSNTASSNRYGIYIYQVYSINNIITSNTASSNDYAGIYLKESSNNIITSNTANSNMVGIYLFSSSNNNTITNNTANSNGVYGIMLHKSSSNNKIYNNNFINSPAQAYVTSDSIGNVFNLEKPTGGNYWSNFDEPAEGCNDANSDGFCDTPYVFTGGQDNLPWAKKVGWLAPQNQPPVALFDYSPENPLVGHEVRFESSSYDQDGEIVKYHWDFGDGNTIEEIAPDGEVVIYTYTEPGTYLVTLTVTDDGGSTSSTQKNINIESWIAVTAWTSGHFTEDPENWAQSVSVPLHVQVSGYEDEGASVSVNGTFYGQTDVNGYLEIDYPIQMPPFVGEYTVVVEAELEGLSATTESITLYDSQKLYLDTIPPFTSWQVEYYNLNQMVEMPFAPGEPEWLTMIRLLMQHFSGYAPKEGDVVKTETYKFTASDVPPVWLVRETVIGDDGQLIFENNEWTENETKYNQIFSIIHKSSNLWTYLIPEETIYITLASPAILYVTAPDGSHAGYDPLTGKLVLDFPIAISDPGDEPFYLFIPQPLECEYKIDVIGIDTGEYTLSIQALDYEGIIGQESNFTNSINENEVHLFRIIVSEEGDIVVEEAIIPASVDCDPDTLNLKSNGQWITCYIELPEGYNVWEIDGATILLNGEVPAYRGKQGWAKAESNESNITDDGKRMVKFDRDKVQEILEPGEVILTIAGKVGLTDFEGKDTIRVIAPGSQGKGKK